MASEKILSKEEIEAALNERHSPEKQKLLSQGQVTIAGLGGLARMWLIRLQESV